MFAVYVRVVFASATPYDASSTCVYLDEGETRPVTVVMEATAPAKPDHDMRVISSRITPHCCNPGPPSCTLSRTVEGLDCADLSRRYRFRISAGDVVLCMRLR